MDLINLLWMGVGASGFAVLVYGTRFLREQLPVEEGEPPVESKASPFDAAFDALDESESPIDAALSNNIFPLAPRAEDRPNPPEPKEPLPLATRILEDAPNHPCRFLDGTRPGHFQEGECPGTCRHNAQNGRLCFWPPQTAAQCGYFMPRVMPSKQGPKKAVNE